MRQFGRIDVAVNNAGYGLPGNFDEMTNAKTDRLMGTNFYVGANEMRAVLPVMLKQRSGRFINVSSTAGVISFAYCSAYS